MIDIKEKEFCFVIDADNVQLAPTSVNKGGYLIRKNRARLVQNYPIVIQLNRVVQNPVCDTVLGG